MFWNLLERGARLLYRPDMIVTHHIEPWKMKRSYFLRLHAKSGFRHARHQLSARPGRKVAGIPIWLIAQTMKQAAKTTHIALRGEPAMRQAMNLAHSIGLMLGAYRAFDTDHST